MDGPNDQVELLTDLMERALRTFITQPAAPQRHAKKGRAEFHLSSPDERRLAGLLGDEWDRIVGVDPIEPRAWHRPRGRMEAARLAVGLLEARGRWFFCRFPDWAYDPTVPHVRGYDDRLSDCPTIARRVAAHLAAENRPAVEAVVVTLNGPLPRIPLAQGWTLAGFDDPVMPIEIGETYREPEDLHRRRSLAILTRDEDLHTPLQTAAAARTLSWPLAVLNLALDVPIRAVAAYRMVPGGEILPATMASQCLGRVFAPAEVYRWEPRPDRIVPRNGPSLDGHQHQSIARCARALDANINQGGLTDWQLAQFWHAIDRLLTVAYHTHDRELPEGEYEPLPFMDSVEATVHLVAALEGLFDDEGNHSDITRRLGQRVAILAAVEDSERTTVRDRINLHYRIRSERAHGSPRSPKGVDVADLRRLVSRAVLGWAALAPDFGTRGALARALDDALLSPDGAGRGISARLAQFRKDYHVSGAATDARYVRPSAADR